MPSAGLDDSIREPLLDSASHASGSSFHTNLDKERQYYRDMLDSELKKVATFVGRTKRELDIEVSVLKRSLHSSLPSASNPVRPADVLQWHDVRAHPEVAWCVQGWLYIIGRDVQAAGRLGGDAATSLGLVEREASRLYVQLSRFANFIDMNREGFRKILKKHDKVTDMKMSSEMMPVVHRLLPAADAEAMRKVPHQCLSVFATCTLQRIAPGAWK